MRIDLSFSLLLQIAILCSNFQTLSSAKCAANKSLIPAAEMYDRNITLLLSYPGSGNTWTRLLIESATDSFSGSVYNGDTQLQDIFFAESRCGLRMSVIKGHPANFILCESSLCLPEGSAEFKKCSLGMISGFKKVLFLVRDPIKAIFSEFQRRVSGSHNGLVESNSVGNLGKRWKKSLTEISNMMEESWGRLIYPAMRKNSPANFHVLKYENLVDEKTRVQELLNAVNFLKFPVDKTKIDCAFEISDESKVHRHSTLSVEDLMRTLNSSDREKIECYVSSAIRNFVGNFSYSLPWSHCT